MKMAIPKRTPYGSTFRDCQMAVRFGTAIVRYQIVKKPRVFMANMSKWRGASRRDFLGTIRKEPVVAMNGKRRIVYVSLKIRVVKH